MSPSFSKRKAPDHLGLPRSKNRRYGFSFGRDVDVTEYIGVKGEVTIDVTNNQIRHHDGTTPGGTVLGNIDLSDIKQRLTTLEESGINLSTALEPIETRVTTLENQELPNYDAEISAINNTLDQMVIDIGNAGGGDTSAIESQLSTLDQKITTLQNQVDNLPKRLLLTVVDFSVENWTVPEGVTVRKAYSGSSMEVTHNQGMQPTSWSGIDRSSSPAQTMIPTSLVNMQIIDDNTVIITSIESTNVFDITINF